MMNYKLYDAQHKLLAVGSSKNKVDARKKILDSPRLHVIETVDYGRKTYTISQVYREF